MAINLSGISLTSDVTGGGGVSGGVTAKMKFIPVTTLPPANEAKKTAVYLLPSKNTTTKNKYDEYVVLETASGFIWELFGQDVSVDLQSFATKTDLNKKQDKLVNQQNIRSINGIPLVGSGNIQLETLTTAEKNKILGLVDTSIKEAPADGKQYARKNGEWSEVEAAGGDVSSESTDEVAANVEESIMAQYGKNITQLGHELSEIDDKYADKIIDVTDSSTFHEELLTGVKTVEVEKTRSWSPMFSDGKNLLELKPRLSNATSGHTYEVNDDKTVTIGGEHLGSVSMFLNDESWSRADFWKQFAGKKLVLCSIGTIGNQKMNFIAKRDGREVTTSVQVMGSKTAMVTSAPLEVPADILYVRVQSDLRGDMGEYTMWHGIYEEGKAPAEVEDEFTTEATTVDTAYYKSTVSTKAFTKEYIDKNAVGGLYVMPEKFGAKGDGVTDDSVAIAKALEYANLKGLPVKMYKNYLVSSPIKVCYDGMNIEMHDVTCKSASGAAIEVDGENNTIVANSIHADYIGIEIKASKKSSTHNDFKVNSIYAKYGIVSSPSKGMLCWQNTFRFNLISGTGIDSGSVAIFTNPTGDYGMTTEFNFYGGHVTNVEYGYIGAGGNHKFYSIQVEANVKTGFWFKGSSYAQIIGDRHSEQMFLESPYLKISNIDETDGLSSASANNEQLKFISIDGIPINRIDVSEAYIKSRNKLENDFEYISDRAIGTIDCSINCGYVEESNGAYTSLAKKAYIWGRKIICVPTYNTLKTITSSVYDMRLNDNSTNCLPTTFKIGVENCAIYLHDSYIHFGINKFKVIQTDTFKAKIYNSDGLLVWNGWNKPSGCYDFEVCYSDDMGYKVGYVGAKYDGEGICWYVNGEIQTPRQDGELDKSYIETIDRDLYVDTGFVPNPNYTYKAVVNVEQDGFGAVFGSRISGTSQVVKIGRVSESTIQVINSKTGGAENSSHSTVWNDSVVEFSLNTEKFKIVGESGIYEDRVLSNSNGAESSLNIFLYQINNGGSFDKSSNHFARIQQFIIEDENGNELIHLHAALKDGVPCFYDSVSDSYKMFSGSGQVSYNKGDGSDAVVATI